jgi:hypothetical protein
MTFLVLSTGAELDLRTPRLEHITAEDMAHSLAQATRFAGRCIRPYSVAEHSLLVAEIAERMFGADVHARFLAVMHDAHEAYCTDMPSPCKSELGPLWARWEANWQLTVHTRFALLSVHAEHHAMIKQADLIALATEKRDLLPSSPTPWPLLEGVSPAQWINLRTLAREKMTWQDWRDRWLDEHAALEFARTEALFGTD